MAKTAVRKRNTKYSKIEQSLEANQFNPVQQNRIDGVSPELIQRINEIAEMPDDAEEEYYPIDRLGPVDTQKYKDDYNDFEAKYYAEMEKANRLLSDQSTVETFNKEESQGLHESGTEDDDVLSQVISNFTSKRQQILSLHRDHGWPVKKIAKKLSIRYQMVYNYCRPLDIIPTKDNNDG